MDIGPCPPIKSTHLEGSTMTLEQQEARAALIRGRKLNFGEILKSARLDKEIGTRKLSAMSGISLSTIRNVERGRADIQLETLQKIVDTLEAL